MIKIRLRRTGAKKKPSYRLVVADVRAPRDGAFVAIIGHYNPLTDPETIVIDEEKALYWLKQGAQPTATATRLLSKVGIIEKPKITKEKPKATEEKPKATKEKPKATKEKPKATKEKPKATKEKTKATKEKT
jgi:small subunit ribosomal protein S16